MKKVLILLDKKVNVNNIDSSKYKDIMVSHNIENIANDDVVSILYLGSCKRYNNSLENGNMVLVNEAFTKVNDEDKRVLSSFSLNFYVSEASNKLNKGISIVNVFSSDVTDDKIQDEMYNNYSCLALDKNSYNVLIKALALKKKASCLLKITDEEVNDVSDLFELALQSLL